MSTNFWEKKQNRYKFISALNDIYRDLNSLRKFYKHPTRWLYKCSKCEEELLFIDFDINKGKKRGFEHTCKQCISKVKRKKYLEKKNKEVKSKKRRLNTKTINVEEKTMTIYFTKESNSIVYIINRLTGEIV